jgi:hypothetical protein
MKIKGVGRSVRRHGQCADCGRLRPISARGLCGSCYGRARNEGHLAEYPTISTPVPNGRTAAEVLDDLDGAITYRQFDNWLRCGWLGAANKANGPGSRRYFDDREVEAIRAIVAEYNAAREALQRISTGERWSELTADELVAQ